MTELRAPASQRTNDGETVEPKPLKKSRICRKIGIFGNFGSTNLGNEGSLEAMMNFLHQVRPDAEIVCICSEPESIRKTYNIDAHPLRMPRSPNASLFQKLQAKLADARLTIRTVRNFDTLIIPGTGILDDFGDRPLGMPLTLFMVCVVAKLRGIKIGFVSVGAGPIRHPLSQRLMKAAASLASYCSFRDSISKQYMSSIGLNTKNHFVYPDIAFKLANPESANRPREGQLCVGIGVMSYYGWKADPDHGVEIYNAYMRKLTAFVNWLLAQGYRVRVVTGEEPLDRRALVDLMAAVTGNGTELGSNQISSAERIGSLHDLMREIALTDIVVATRFHNVVCALKMGRPTISLGYAEKNDVLLADMGLGTFCQHIENFDLYRLKDNFKKIMINRDLLTRGIRYKNKIYLDCLVEQEKKLIDKLLIR